MNGEVIQADTSSALVSQHAIRETVVGRVVGITASGLSLFDWMAPLRD